MDNLGYGNLIWSSYLKNPSLHHKIDAHVRLGEKEKEPLGLNKEVTSVLKISPNSINDNNKYSQMGFWIYPHYSPHPWK